MKRISICIFVLAISAILPLTAAPEQIMIIRPAEKNEKAEGIETLSMRGRERAAALVPFLLESKNLIGNGLPVAIYAMAPVSGQSASEAVDTVTPIAEKLKITVNNKFEKENYKKMVDEIKTNTAYSGKCVLICWDHTGIPELARAFSALQTPGKWPVDSFDRVWLITYSPTGKAVFLNVPQKLLFGDSPR